MIESVSSPDFDDSESIYSAHIAISSILQDQLPNSPLSQVCNESFELLGKGLLATQYENKSVRLREKIKPLKVDASGRVEITASFGGSDKVEVTVSGKAEIRDNRGNSAEVKVETDGKKQILLFQEGAIAKHLTVDEAEIFS